MSPHSLFFWKKFSFSTLTVFLVCIIPLLTLTGCKDRYEEGRKSGYKTGYETGERNGYSRGYAKGEEDGYAQGLNDGYNNGFSKGDQAGHVRGLREGYDNGYKQGTIYFLEKNGLPSLGLIILLFLSFLVLFWLYLTWRGRLKRKMEHLADRREAQRQKESLAKELIRIRHSYIEAAHVLAASIQATVYTKARMGIGSSKITLSLDRKIREIEAEVFAIYSKEIDKMTRSYNKVVLKVDGAKHLSSKERGKLFVEMKKRISHSPNLLVGGDSYEKKH